MKNYGLFLCFILLLFSCGNKDSKTNVDDKPVIKKVQLEKKVYQNDSVLKVEPYAIYLVEDLDLYTSLTSQIENLEGGTKDQILNQGEGLTLLTMSLKDSTENELMNDPAMRARLNALYTISLRLKDMQDIPSISAEEVFATGDQIVGLYNSVINKINTEALRAEYESQLDEELVSPTTNQIPTNENIFKKTTDRP